MRILAVDTATEACSVALVLDDRIIEDYIELGRGHAERILPMVDSLLARAQMKLADLDAIAVGRGPGGFTGVRLGVGVAQGLAFGARKPVIGISNLAAVALQAFDLHRAARRVLVCNDARMKEIYTAVYERADPLIRLQGIERVAAPGSVELDREPAVTVGAGRGFRAYPHMLDRLSPALAAVENDLLPRASTIARLAVHAFAAGEAVDPARITPVYLRDDVAQPSPRLS